MSWMRADGFGILVSYVAKEIIEYSRANYNSNVPAHVTPSHSSYSSVSARLHLLTQSSMSPTTCRAAPLLMPLLIKNSGFGS